MNDNQEAPLILSEELAESVTSAIRSGDVEKLRGLLNAHPELVRARVARRDDAGQSNGNGNAYSLLHLLTDWPGRCPNGAETVAVLVEAGADVNAKFVGPHSETPLHWAASCDDIEVLDALIRYGADLEAPGAVIADGTPLDDAVAFAQWQAAQRLIAHGARYALWHAAALGMLDAMEAHFAGDILSRQYPWGASRAETPDEVTVALWCACHGGQREAAELLLRHGAELNWVSVWDRLTPLDAALRSSADALVSWLRDQGAKTAQELLQS
ncbi:hypothetical protein PA598K_02799 [Paenibacillus sp. 598K]|uniref:ankyrin repeat domain-containing protein n=1 Tax=Paenibacillus sp. 598K TaxID=1117987 RepID=UPI000FF963D4|nr:ankyrin repeat domain-containing protein [Paenibacillus sp. 598K]GBF74454.1 hypothetical protein PA598K_02799 [Paenibacillus sp. 598K]